MSCNEACQGYLAQVKAANPRLFTAEKVKMAPDALERVMRRAFHAGWIAAQAGRIPPNGEGAEMFRRLFGGG